MITLVELTPSWFDWLADESAPSTAGLTKPASGVESPAVLSVVRRMTERLWAGGCRAAWMIVENDEVVGLCSYKAAPDIGEVEVGYSVAADRRSRGDATTAVQLMIESTLRDLRVDRLLARTAGDNVASERVLEANGFVEVGRELDPEDGPVRVWSLSLRP